MKNDIVQNDLQHLINIETYDIDIYKGGACNSIYINAKTLFEKHGLITGNEKVKTFLERNKNNLATYTSFQILSNMPNVNIPLKLGDRLITVINQGRKVERYVRSSEHLYQAFRFPDNDNNYQMDVLSQNASRGAKMKAKRKICRDSHIEAFRNMDYQNPENDLDAALTVVRIMYQVLRIKLAYKQKLPLAQEDENFGKKLLQTGTKQIIEVAPKQSGGVDTFWGTKINADGTLTGRNVMGKLLMYIRDNYLEDVKNKQNETRNITIPSDLNLNLLGQQLTQITAP